MPQQTYIVTNTRDETGVDESGQLKEFKTVFFRTALGDTGRVRIPKTDFSDDLARALIQAEVDEIYKLREVK